MNHFQALVVEDNPTLRETLQNALTRLGCRVTAVSTAERARDALSSQPFDAVFAELCARGDGGGRGIARWLKSRCTGTVCFLVTGWKGELEPNLLRHDGIHGIIRKPLIFNEIRDSVLEHFG